MRRIVARSSEEPSRVVPPAQPKPPLRPSPDALQDGDEQRALSSWDWLAIPALAAAGLVIAGVLGLHEGGGGHEYPLAMKMLLVLGILGGVLTLGLAALGTRRAGLGFPGFLRALSDVWVH